MTNGPAWRRYLRFWRSNVTEDVDDEIRFHIEMRIREYMALGMSEADARAAITERLGDVDAAKEACVALGEERERQAKQAAFFDALRADIRYALRSLRRTPGWTTVALLTIALGIGATTAVFRVTDTLLVDTIHYPDASRVYVFRRLWAAPDGHMFSAPFARAGVDAWRKNARSVEAVQPFWTQRVWLSDTPSADSTEALGAAIDSGFLDLAGVRPLLGRDFTAIERAPRGPGAVLLSESFWRMRFGASPAAVGKVLYLDGKLHTIVGVLPATLQLPDLTRKTPDVWLPYMPELVNAVAVRLRPGVSPEAATQELDTILARVVKDPPWWRDMKLRNALIKPQDVLEFRQALTLLTGAVALLLLVACINVAHLLLVRGAARQRELAVRFALGAGRWRIVRQLVTETLVVALGGGVLAVIIAWIGLRALQALRPDDLTAFEYVHAGHGIVTIAAVLAIATGLAVGLVSALKSAQRDAGAALRHNASGASVAGRRLRGGLVVGEIALSATLLVAALLLIHALYDVERRHIGFDAAGMYAITFTLGDSTAASQRTHFGELLRERARAIPGVEQVTLGTSDFMLMSSWVTPEQPEPGTPVGTGMTDVAADYFKVMRMPLLAGHVFDAGSATDGEVIISSSLARQLWGDADPLGRRFHNARPIGAGENWMTVIGVVPDVVDNLLQSNPSPQIYQATSAFSATPPSPRVTLVLRLRAGADAADVERFALAENPSHTTPHIENVREELDKTAAEPRFTMRIMIAFATLGVLLSAIGLFGVISYSVGQRTREIGVRMALGATRVGVASLIVGDGLRLALFGIAFGLLGATAATRVLQSTLYGVSPLDPASFAACALALLVVSLLACVVPMLRATAIDPAITVRAE